MRLCEHSAVADPHRTHHEQAKVPHDRAGDPGIGDVVAGDVEAEALSLDAAPVRELDLEVELDPVIHACLRSGARRGNVLAVCRRRFEPTS